MSWQDISTAPKDGTPVNLYRPRCTAGEWTQRVIGVWSDELLTWVWPDAIKFDGWWEDLEALIEDDDIYESDAFTHWMPLAEPPA